MDNPAHLCVLMLDPTFDAIALRTAAERSLPPMQFVLVPDAAACHEALAGSGSLYYDAVVIGCGRGGVDLLREVVAGGYYGPLIAVGDAADEEAAYAAGATAYMVAEGGYAAYLPLAIKSAVLEQQVEELQEFRDQFVSVASHELKNPLAAMRGYAELLLRRMQRGGADERTAKGLSTILQQSLRMQYILDDLHDLSRLSRGQLELQRSELNIEQLMSRVIEAQRCDEKSTPVELLRGGPLLHISGDAERLQHVFARLIEIAAAHSPADVPVQVLIGEESTPDEQRRVRVEIRSQGGMMVREMEQAFKHFYSSTSGARINATERLSLYVSAALIRLHDGLIRFERANGGDSVFCVMLPQLVGEPVVEARG